MRLSNAEHTGRPWRIHEMTPDFRLEDVWELPTPGGADDFHRLVHMVSSSDPANGSSRAARDLWAIRWKIGELLGWDEQDAKAQTLRERLPVDLRDGSSGPEFAAGLSLNPHIRDADTIRHWVFFLGVPLLTLGASIAWLGEIFQMERDAHYMRLLEQSTWTNEELQDKYAETEKVSDDDVRYPALLLNTWVAHSDPPARNRVVGYVGGLLIYMGTTAASLALACALLRENRSLAFALSAAWLIFYTVLTIAQLVRILNYSKLSPDQATRRFASPRI